jgi:hypothetical protein
MKIILDMHVRLHYALISLAIIPGYSLAFEPLNTDDAGTVKKDGNQVEIYSFTTNQHDSNALNAVDLPIPDQDYVDTQYAHAYPVTYTRGIGDNIEASIGSAVYAQPKGAFSPVSNSAVAMKWRFAESEDGDWALAIKPSVRLPSTPSQQVAGLGYSALNYGATLIGSVYWNAVEIHANVAYAKASYNTNYSTGQNTDPNRTNILFFSIAPVWTVSPGIRLALDMGLTTNPPTTEQYLSNYGLVAAIFSPIEAIDIGLSYMRSAANFGIVTSGSGANTTRTEVGVTWRF